MKKCKFVLFPIVMLTVFISLSSSLSAANCPDLSGVYQCQNGSDIMNLSISQEKKDFDVYSIHTVMNTSSLVASNILKIDAPTEPIGRMMTLVSCEKNSLVARYGINGLLFSEVRYSKDRKENLRSDTYVNNMENNSQWSSYLADKLLQSETWFKSFKKADPSLSDLQKLQNQMVSSWKWTKLLVAKHSSSTCVKVQ